MSRYLIDRIASLANVELHTLTEVAGLEQEDDGALSAVRWRRKGGEEVRAPVRHLFLFVGADPNTRWLADCGFALDEKGFVLTGPVLEASDLAPYGWSRQRARRRPWRPTGPASSPLATSAPVRPSASPRRWARGPRWWPQIHAYLAL